MQIQVHKKVYELAKLGVLQVITAHLDPGADKELQEGATPNEITLKARGTQRKGIKFQVVGQPDRVLKGYEVRSTKNDLIDRMNRPTARVVIGPQIKEIKSDHESPPV